MRRKILGIFISTTLGVILQQLCLPHHPLILGLVILALLLTNSWFIKFSNKLVVFLILGILLTQITSISMENDPLVAQKTPLECKAVITEITKVQNVDKAAKTASSTEAAVTSRGQISGKGKNRKLQDKYRIMLKITSYKEGQLLITNLDTRCLATYLGTLKSQEDLIGKTISFKSEIKTPPPSRNPHTFNYNLYLKSKGILVETTLKSFKIQDLQIPLKYRIKKKIIELRLGFLNKFHDESSRSFASGVLFGDSSKLDQDTLSAFRANGTAHILAVSGLHIGILYGLYMAIQKKLRRRIFEYLFLGFLLAYGTATLWSPSVTRAIILVFMKCFADRYCYKFDFTNSVSLIGVFLILKNPFVIYDVSFQLSFLAAFFIGFLMPIISSIYRGSLGFLLGIQCFLCPYMAFVFNKVSPVGIIANIPVVFIVSIYVPLGILCLVIYILTGTVPPFSITILESLSTLCIEVNKLFYFNQSFALDIPSPPLVLLLLFYLLVFYLASEDFLISMLRSNFKKVSVTFLVIFLVCLSISGLGKSPFDKCKLVFVDVGPGDCLHLKLSHHRNVLIDGGGSENTNIGEKVVKPYLLKNGAGKLDNAMVSDYKTDHSQGLKELSLCFPISSYNVKGKTGDTVRFSKNEFVEILMATKKSKVLKVHCGGVTALILGDLSKDEEDALVDMYRGTGRLRCDVLRVLGHGRNSNTSWRFIRQVKPKIAVITPNGNKFGSPPDKVISRLEKCKVKVYRTDKSGAIGVWAEGGEIRVCTQIK